MNWRKRRRWKRKNSLQNVRNSRIGKYFLGAEFLITGITSRDAMLRRTIPSTRYGKAQSLSKFPTETSICELADDSESTSGDKLGDDVGYGNLGRYRSVTLT